MSEVYDWHLSHGPFRGTVAEFDRHVEECATCSRNYWAARRAAAVRMGYPLASDLPKESPDG